MDIRSIALVGGTALLIVGSAVGIGMASPPSGVSPEVIARGTYPDFKVRSSADSPIEIRQKSKTPVDLVVRKHSYAPGSTTGWHRHPGPVFITVTEGTLTYYLYDDPTCTPHHVRPGEGIVDDGRGHTVRNESALPAKDVSVILAPVGGTFRSELDAPSPHCNF